MMLFCSAVSSQHSAGGQFHGFVTRSAKNVYAHQHDSEKQESPAIADKPARRESLPKIAPIRRAYNVVADNTGLSLCI